MVAQGITFPSRAGGGRISPHDVRFVSQPAVLDCAASSLISRIAQLCLLPVCLSLSIRNFYNALRSVLTMELELNTTMQYWWEALSISLSIPSQQQTQGTLFVKAQFNLNKMSFRNKLVFSKILMM